MGNQALEMYAAELGMSDSVVDDGAGEFKGERLPMIEG